MNLEELGLTPEQLDTVNKAIQSSEDKVRFDYSGKLKIANDELVKYKPVDKTDAELQLELKQKELEQKEKELAMKEKSYTVKDKLAEKGLPSELAKFISIGDDVDTTIEELGGTLNNYFLENGFKPNNHIKNEGTTKDQFKSMSYLEKAKLFKTNPSLYNKLSN